MSVKGLGPGLGLDAVTQGAGEMEGDGE